MHVSSCAFFAKQMTLDPADEDVAWIVFFENLEMRVKTVTIHSYVEAASLTLRTDFYLSALDLGSHGKNCVVRDQSFCLLNF